MWNGIYEGNQKKITTIILFLCNNAYIWLHWLITTFIPVETINMLLQIWHLYFFFFLILHQLEPKFHHLYHAWSRTDTSLNRLSIDPLRRWSMRTDRYTRLAHNAFNEESSQKGIKLRYLSFMREDRTVMQREEWRLLHQKTVLRTSWPQTMHC